LLGNVFNHVTTAATNENTSYRIDEQLYAQYQVPANQLNNPHMEVYLLNVILSNEDIIGALQAKFPDCVVSFQETWVDAEDNTRVLKKGILIDWS
jgi:hypothetical protein